MIEARVRLGAVAAPAMGGDGGAAQGGERAAYQRCCRGGGCTGSGRDGWARLAGAAAKARTRLRSLRGAGAAVADAGLRRA
jgi:hypothetical protein